MNNVNQMQLLKKNDYFIYSLKDYQPKIYVTIENNIFNQVLLAYSNDYNRNEIINYSDANKMNFIFLGKKSFISSVLSLKKFKNTIYNHMLRKNEIFNIDKTDVINVINKLTPDECRLAIENLEYVKILLEKKAFEQV